MNSAKDRLLRYAFLQLARTMDSRFESLLLTGRISKWYSEVGHEATTVAAGLALEAGDALCTLHRDLGAILARYLDPERTFPGLGFSSPGDTRPEPESLIFRLGCQLLGKGEGFSEGMERSFHYSHLAPEQGILHVGMISHLGAMIPVAAGCAFALKQAGTDRVAVNFIGDGGTSTGDFHEGLNMAAVWKLPLILIIENNQFAYSTPNHRQYAAEKLSDKAAGYGIPGFTVDGNDPDMMAGVMQAAITRARRGHGPTLIEAMLGRLRGHSEGDDSLKVIPKEDLERYRAEDPLRTYPERLRREGILTESLENRLKERIGELVELSIDKALEAPLPEASWARRSVFAPVDSPKPVEADRPLAEEKITYVRAIQDALTEEMERDEKVVLMGQDIGAFEGAFRVTRGLHARWSHRVLDTPIAESGTIGIAAGAAILGYRPVVEMQFSDFVTCGFNQIANMLAKLYYRWKVPCPVVLRLPSGGGVGAGPFHSQNPEGWFTHIPGLKVVCPATTYDAKALMKSAIRDPNPVIFLEHKFLYRRIKDTLPQGEILAEIGKAAVRREGSDLTLIGYGASTWWCLEAADRLAESGVNAEVVDLRTLVPFDEETVVQSVKKTGRALVAHEATLTGGFGAEVVARIADAAFPWLDAPIRRVAFPDRPSPYAKVLENELMPTVDDIVATAKKILAF